MKNQLIFTASLILLLAISTFNCHSSKDTVGTHPNTNKEYNSIHFEESRFKNALALAKKENKVIFVDVYARWCGPCKMMEREVFTDAEVANVYNSNFINLKIDGDLPEGNSFMKKYDIRSYPSFLFIDENGEVLDRKSGMMSSPQFRRWGQKIGKRN